MTYIKLLLVVLVLAAFIPPAHSQEDTILLNSSGLRDTPAACGRVQSQAPPAEKLDCVRCHHDFDAIPEVTGAERGKPVIRATKGKPIMVLPSLKDAFHFQCITCHQRDPKKGAGYLR